MLVRQFYIKDILKIASPIILGNLGFILIGVGDVIIAGRYSTDALASISIATAIINCIMMLGIGVLCTISPILSNYRGAGKQPERYFYPSLKFVGILSIIISLLLLCFIPIVDKLGFDVNLVMDIKKYFFITAFSTFGAFLHCMTKEYLQAFEIVLFPNILTIFSIFVNVILNLVLAFGYGFIPEMGVAGLALASLLTRYFMGIVLLIYCYKKIKIVNYKDKMYYQDLIKVGVPSSLAIIIEFIGFNAITVIMGRVSGIYAAAHNIMCTLTSVSFMIPLAISNATAVKVGFTNGANYFKSMKKYAYTGMFISVLFMACSAITISFIPHFLINLFTTDVELIKICVPIVYILCLFQIFDGLQVSLAGIFRGLKQTKIVMISNLVSFWVVAIPLGTILAFYFNLNLYGFWIGIGIGSIILCFMMLFILLRKFKTIE